MESIVLALNTLQSHLLFLLDAFTLVVSLQHVLGHSQVALQPPYFLRQLAYAIVKNVVLFLKQLIFVVNLAHP